MSLGPTWEVNGDLVFRCRLRDTATTTTRGVLHGGGDVLPQSFLPDSG